MMRRMLLLAVTAALAAGCATPDESTTGDGTGDIADRDGTIGDGVEDPGNPLDGGETNETAMNDTAGNDTAPY